jgi:hypothetical protein
MFPQDYTMSFLRLVAEAKFPAITLWTKSIIRKPNCHFAIIRGWSDGLHRKVHL